MSKATNLHRKTTKVHYYKVIVDSTSVNGRQSIKSQKDFSKKTDNAEQVFASINYYGYKIKLSRN